MVGGFSFRVDNRNGKGVSFVARLDLLFTPTDRWLERALDGLAERQRVIAHNLANVDTPGYKRLHYSFEDALKQAMQGNTNSLRLTTTHANHIASSGASGRSSIRGTIERSTQTSMRNDGNNVDVEAERVQAMKDQVQYNAVVTQLNMRFAMLKDVIRQGRR